ncbi:MAG: hypothetical protein HKP30_11775, partial [Myxococcales bacterium]|nr:hypothetical protein [Myxococcales bacterium]
MLDALLDFSSLTAQGADTTAYLVMALAGTFLFLLRLGFALFVGADIDMDADVDADVGSDASFSLFSLLSILAFFMGAGWMGLACRLEWGVGRFGSAMAALGFGGAMMLFASLLMYGTRRLNQEITYDVGTAVGTTARVYARIPAKGEGAGQVEVTVSGRRK